MGKGWVTSLQDLRSAAVGYQTSPPFLTLTLDLLGDIRNRACSHTDAYPDSVLCFEDTAVEDGGLHVMWDGDDSCNFFTSRRRDGLSHLFQEVFSIEPSPPLCKEAMLAVQTVLGLDWTGRVVLNAGYNLHSLSCKTDRPCQNEPCYERNECQYQLEGNSP